MTRVGVWTSCCAEGSLSNTCSSMRHTGAMAGGSGRGHEHPIPPVPPSRRHCWVRGTRDAPGPHPGIVTAWEQREGQWFGLVTYYLEPDRVLAQQWLQAELLSPVGPM